MKKYILHTVLSIGLVLAAIPLFVSADGGSEYFCSTVYSPIARGARGEAVLGLQTLLSENYGYNIPVTGFYGSMTSGAIRQIQAELGFATPGNLGPLTLASLRATWCGGGGSTGGNTTQASITLNQTSTGDGATLIWSSVGVNNCSLNGESVFTDGNRYVRVNNNTTYRLVCQSMQGQSIEQSVTVLAQNNNWSGNNWSNVLPTLSLSGEMYTGGQVGICVAGVVSPCNGSGYITVQSSNANSCTISGGMYSNSNIGTNTSFNVSPTVPTRYTVTCSGNGGNVSQSIVLTPNQSNTTNGTLTTNASSYNTGNTISINWSAPSSYSSEVQGVLLELVRDGASFGTIARITNQQNAVSGRFEFIIPKALVDTRNDAISCSLVNGETLCGNILRSGTYRIRATYFTPSNACFGFCQFVTNQRTLGTVESQNFTLQSTVQ
jgi:peptidoglycan hydrolase-like protein with peptidoglycan-binding domain